MKHRHLRYIDHYHVGTSVTPKAIKYVKKVNNLIQPLKQKNNSNNTVKVKHYVMSYEEFLNHKSFNIIKLIDPNTSNGFYHNILNTIEFDKGLKYKYLKETGNKILPSSLDF